MAGINVLHGVQGNSQTTANTTQRCPILGRTGWTTGNNNFMRFRTPGTITKLFVFLSANNINATTDLHLKKNSATTLNNALSITANATGSFEDTTHSDTISAADNIELEHIPGAATGTINITAISFYFQSSTDGETCRRLGCRSASGLVFNAASVTNYSTIEGSDAIGETVEANAQLEQRRVGDYKNLAVHVTASTTNSAITVTLRNNGASTSLTVSLTAATTGWFEDTTHTVTVAQGDLIDLEYVTPSGMTGSCTIGSGCLDFITTTNHAIFVDSNDAGSAIAANLTRFLGLTGNSSVLTQDARAQFKIGNAVVREITCYITANTVTAATTIKIRRNGVNGNNSISIPSSSTGRFSDYSGHEDVFDPTTNNLISYAIITGATGTSITIRSMQAWIMFGVVPSSVNILKYNIRKLVTNQDTLKYNIRKLITQTDTLKYNIRVLSGQQIDTIKYNIRKLVSQTDTLKYNILKLITQTDTLKYNIRRLTGQQTDTIKYNIRRLVTQTDTLKYNVRKLITQSDTLKYNIRKLVTNTDTLKYNVRKLVSKTNTFIYNILIQITTATHEYIFKYNIRKKVTNTDTLIYKIRQLSSHTLVSKYNIRKLTGLRTYIFRYAIRISTGPKTLILKYRIFGLVHSMTTFLYNVKKKGPFRHITVRNPEGDFTPKERIPQKSSFMRSLYDRNWGDPI